MISIFKKNIDEKKTIVLLFLLVVLGDALTKIFYSHQHISPSKYVKAIVTLFLVLYTFKNHREFYIYFILSFIAFLIGSISISLDRFLENLSQFFEYYFFVLFFLAFQNTPLKKFSTILDIVFLSHALIIIIAAIFEITFLKTYEWGSRFGFLSLFNSQNEFSYVVMAGIMFFYAKVEIKPLIKIIKLAIMTIAGLLVGTKAIILFLLILSGYFLLFRTKPKRAIPFVLFIVLMFLFLWEKILHFFKANYNTLYNLYESEGFLSFLSSKRTSYVGDRLMNSLEEFDFTNYLFGTYDLGNLYEMSLLDIPFFFGVIGTGLFGYIIYRFVLKKMFFNQQLSAYLIIVIGISLVAGYLMENASAQLYTLLVLMVLGDDFSSSSFRTDKNKEKIKL